MYYQTENKNSKNIIVNAGICPLSEEHWMTQECKEMIARHLLIDNVKRDIYDYESLEEEFWENNFQNSDYEYDFTEY